jgi:hypothetical protein
MTVPMPERPRLRKREIVLAVAMGLLAAGGAAAILDDQRTDAAPMVATADNLTYEVGPFQALSTTGPQDVVITLGDTRAVRVEGSPEALARLEAVVRDGTLTIGPKERFRNGFNWSRLSGVTFYVTVPRLEAVSLAGSGSVRLDRAEGPAFSGSVAGPGELTIGAMRVDRADFSIAGSGDVVAAGSAGEARLSIMGSGEAHTEALRSKSAAVSIGGSGDAALTVDGNARVSIMGSGDVDIAGNAHCTVSRMGSGDVRCANR